MNADFKKKKKNLVYFNRHPGNISMFSSNEYSLSCSFYFVVMFVKI